MSAFENSLNIICLECEAFHQLIEEVVDRLSEKQAPKEKWVNDAQAMQLLNISSATTLHKYRNEGKIRFTQPSRKLILYDRDSIMEFLEKHAQDTF